MLPVPSRMVQSCREWFAPSRLGSNLTVAIGYRSLRKVQTVVAKGSNRRREWVGAVANGSEPSRNVQSRREWFAPSRLIFPLRSLRIDRSCREWFRPSRIVIGDGLGAIDDSLGAISDGEARRRLRLGVRRLGLGVTATGFVFQKNKN